MFAHPIVHDLVASSTEEKMQARDLVDDIVGKSAVCRTSCEADRYICSEVSDQRINCLELLSTSQQHYGVLVCT